MQDTRQLVLSSKETLVDKAGCLVRTHNFSRLTWEGLAAEAAKHEAWDAKMLGEEGKADEVQ